MLVLVWCFLQSKKFYFKHNFNKSLKQNEDDDKITDSHVSDKLRYALIDLRTSNPDMPHTSPLPIFRQPPNFKKRQNPVFDVEVFPKLQTIFGKKQEIPTTIDEPPVQKQEEDAMFPDEFRRHNHWRPHWYRCINKCLFRSGLTENPTFSTANIFTRGTSPPV